MTIDLSDQLDKKSKIYISGASQDWIVTSSDKIKLQLIDYNKKIKNVPDLKCSFRELINSVVISITCFLPIVASDFKNEFLGLASEIWTAIFIILTILSVCYFLYNVYIFVRDVVMYIKYSKKDYIADVISSLKGDFIIQDNESNKEKMQINNKIIRPIDKSKENLLRKFGILE